MVKGKELKEYKIIVSAIFLSLMHFILAGFLSFFGTVIEPTAIQQSMSVIALVMTLPFCIFNFIDFGSSSINSVTSTAGTILGLIFWAWAYFRILKKRPRSR